MGSLSRLYLYFLWGVCLLFYLSSLSSAIGSRVVSRKDRVIRRGPTFTIVNGFNCRKPIGLYEVGVVLSRCHGVKVVASRVVR